VDVRRRLAERFGIPEPVWDRTPQADLPGADDTPAAALARRLIAHANASDATRPLPDDPDGLDSLITQVREAREAPGLSEAALARLGAIEVRAIEAREKMRSMRELAGRAPEILTLLSSLEEQLAVFPLARLVLCRNAIAMFRGAQELANWDAGHAQWRTRHRELVEHAEAADRALAAILPVGATFERSTRA